MDITSGLSSPRSSKGPLWPKRKPPGYDYILRGDRVVFKTLADTARMDIWLSGPCRPQLVEDQFGLPKDSRASDSADCPENPTAGRSASGLFDLPSKAL